MKPMWVRKGSSAKSGSFALMFGEHRLRVLGSSFMIFSVQHVLLK
jgi:hypothetical protein